MSNLKKIIIGTNLVQITFVFIAFTINSLYAQTNVTIRPGQSKTFSHTIHSAATSYSVRATSPLFITVTDLGASSFSGFITFKYKISVSLLAPAGTYSVTVEYKFAGSFFPNTYSYNVTTGTPSPVEDEKLSAPLEFSLKQNYPNPFNITTVITYSIPKPNKVLLQIFDINGKLIKVLVDKEQPQGIYHVKWDGMTSIGHQASSGIYFYKILVGAQTVTKKMSLVK